MKYTAEEVRAIAKRLHDDITVADGDTLMASDMLTAYAERIEASEGVVPVAYQSKRRPEDYPDEWHKCSKETFDTIKRMKDSPWIVRELFDRPPAQAAQPVDIEAIREVIESHINEAKKLRHDPESQDYLYEQADKLEAALQENGNG